MSDSFPIKANSIIARKKAAKLAEEAMNNGFSTIDLSQVEFVSRSVADELVHYREEYDLEYSGVQNEVEAMIKAVGERGPAAPAN